MIFREKYSRTQSLHIQAWASALPSDLDWAMREASICRTVTDTDSYAFSFINQSRQREDDRGNTFNMNGFVNRLLIVSIQILLCMFSMSAQEEDLLSYTPIGKEKLKEIVCKHTPIKMAGWIDNKEFVDNSPIQIWEISNYDEKLIVSGIVKNTGETTLITGTYYGKYTPETVSYANRNNSTGKECSGLFFSMMNSATISANRDNFSEMSSTKEKHRVSGIFKVWNERGKRLIATDKSKKIDSRRYEYEPFCISIKQASECHTDFYPKNFFSKQRMVLHQQELDNGDWRIEIDHNLWQRMHQGLGDCKEIESISRISDDISYDIDGEWTVLFSNGDKWVGKIYDYSGSWEKNVYLGGALYLANGDMVKSNLDGIGSKYIYCLNQNLSALHHYDDYLSIGAKSANGEIIKLGKHGDVELNDSEQRDIYNSCLTPSSYMLEVQEQNKAKIAREEEKRQQRIKDREAEYIRKYGTKFGKALSEKRLLKGMSQDMVNEIFPRQLYNRKMMGNKVVWLYNHNSRNSFMGALFELAVIEAGKRMPRQMDFINDKLVSLLY